MSSGKKFSYGSHAEQFIRLTYPEQEKHGNEGGAVDKCPVIAIIHGGFWKEKYGVDNSAIDSLCPFFAARGFAVCEVEYRRREHEGGGFPGTNLDCVSALRHLHELSQQAGSRLDTSRLVLLGHSAGAYLALWVCCSKAEYSPRLDFSPLLCIALAPIADLRAAHSLGLGDEGDAVHRYEETPRRSCAFLLVLTKHSRSHTRH